MEFIKPGINIDFMKASGIARLFSVSLVLASVAVLLTLGLNLGIDFKGGTKIIAAFSASDGQDVDRDRIREVVRNIAEEQLGTRDVQVEVQDFFSGGVGAGENRRYQVLTELTTFLGDERRTSLENDLTALFGDNLRSLNVVREGEDKFYVLLKEKRPVTETSDKIREIFSKHNLKQIKLVSSVERQMDIGFYRDLNLQLKESSSESDGGGELEALKVQQSLEEHQVAKAEKLTNARDDEYEIRVEELKLFLENAFKAEFAGQFQEVESFTSISASVGRDLLNTGLLAIFYAIIGILLYIWLRFDIRYSPGAVLALLHDVLITLGIFALLQIKFTLPIIAAVLTIIGYSLNDTIVVYDRIRENLSRVQQREIINTVNRSINETLSRTILTSVTTLIVVLCLLFFGGGLIRDFALALTIGVIVGTYSSIYVASPVVVFLDKIVEAKKLEQRTLGKSPGQAQSAVSS